MKTKTVKNIKVIKEFWEGPYARGVGYEIYNVNDQTYFTSPWYIAQHPYVENEELTPYGQQLLRDGYIEVEYQDGLKEKYEMERYYQGEISDEAVVSVPHDSRWTEKELSDIANAIEAVKSIRGDKKKKYKTPLPERTEEVDIWDLIDPNQARKLNQLIDCIAELREEGEE